MNILEAMMVLMFLAQGCMVLYALCWLIFQFTKDDL